jgi:hypothetical protein
MHLRALGAEHRHPESQGAKGSGQDVGDDKSLENFVLHTRSPALQKSNIS